MTIIAYQSTSFCKIVARGVYNTSSQILLSGGVVGLEPLTSFLENETAAPRPPCASVFQSDTHRVTSIGEAPRNMVVQYLDGRRSPGLLDAKNDHVCHSGSSPLKTPPSDLDSICSSVDQDSFKSFDTCQLCKSSVSQKADTSKGKDVERGRTFDQRPRAANPLERAESRRRKEDPTIELDARSISPRLSRSGFFEDRNDSCAVLDDTLLEPFPHGPIRGGVSERIEMPTLSMQSEVDASRRCAGFSRKNLSLSVEPKALYSTTTLARETILDFLPNISYYDYPELTPSDQIRSSLKPLERGVSVASNIPAEILYQIYLYLTPTDFNSARHICRVWYASSLERSLLETMLKRGGWSSNIKSRFSSNHAFGSQAQASEEWLMSKRLARECALGPDWSGNGLCFMWENVHFDHHRLSLNVRRTPLVRTSTTDFTDVESHYPGGAKDSPDMSFTVSACRNILMVAQGCLVTLYELNKNDNQDWESGSLRPVTCVICPRRVLACSMDISSHRYAIAVLLDGHMGLVCDISGFSKPSRRLRFSSQPTPNSRASSRQSIYIRSPTPQNSSFAPIVTSCILPIISADTWHSSESERGAWQDIIPHSDISGGSGGQAGPSRQRRPKIESRPNPSRSNRRYPISIEPSAPTLYAPLSSVDDPPRSVALCPQRRCVAFGCSAGIELHWVDALTGQDLSRWFPLTAPSDYLYFLPPRAGIDNAKKLRLISSAGQPGERPVLAEKFARSLSRSSTENRARSSPFWGMLAAQHSGDWIGLGAPASDGSSVDRGMDNSDHYRAIPLSDGYHILFTDPATGLLCLGSDAPIGGPNKLRRKIWFAGHKGQGPPVAYAAGSDLKWGVRVVAAYGHDAEQTLWLFSVPADIFATSMANSGMSSLPFAGISSPNGDSNMEWMKWWSDTGFQDWIDPAQQLAQEPASIKDKIWPLQIRGQEFGKCRGLVDLAIDSGPEMTIWAFGKDGIAQTWQIDNGRLNGTVRKRFVIHDGTIREGDAEGDIEMRDAPSSRSGNSSPSSLLGLATLGEQTFDGAASTMPDCPFSVDADGDVLMTDVPNASHDNDSACLMALPRGTSAQFLDLIDEWTGIARIDIEISIA